MAAHGAQPKDMSVLAGLSAWLALKALSHHAHAFAPERADLCPLVDFLGGRSDMIRQLGALKEAVSSQGASDVCLVWSCCGGACNDCVGWRLLVGCCRMQDASVGLLILWIAFRVNTA
jgi:hypothetical protein